MSEDKLVSDIPAKHESGNDITYLLTYSVHGAESFLKS